METKTVFARRLRRQATRAERRLWVLLRDRRLHGWKFRRQRPVGPYIVDFICLEAGLVVEVDGSHHGDSPTDPRRTAWLEKRGYRVVRFWNGDILNNREAVMRAIVGVLENSE